MVTMVKVIISCAVEMRIQIIQVNEEVVVYGREKQMDDRKVHFVPDALLLAVLILKPSPV